MNRFNAILIGGPPHSGKSVLTYSLTQNLRQQGVEHYVIRACPDGEGDWSNEAPPDTVRLIRQKGSFTAEFTAMVAADLSRRHLPLLVDVGGKPQPDQEVIFAQCTHAVLIAPDEAGLGLWRSVAERNGLNIIAELVSQLEGESWIERDGQLLRAHLMGLQRHHQAQGPVFDALAVRVATYLFEPPEALRRQHLDQAPVDLAIDLQELAHDFGADGSPYWRPQHLPQLLDYLPPAVSGGLYGRGPNWIFAAVAAHLRPAPFYLFDVRLGWIRPPEFTLEETPATDVLSFRVVPQNGFQMLEMLAPGYYLDYTDFAQATAPRVTVDQGLVLSGRVPHWLLAGIVRAYCGQPWVAVYQPQLGNQAVVVASRVGELAAGALVPLAPR